MKVASKEGSSYQEGTRPRKYIVMVVKEEKVSSRRGT